MKKENDLPNWLNPNEGQIWFSPLEPEKLRIYKNEKWQEIDPFVDLEERKVKKPEETND